MIYTHIVDYFPSSNKKINFLYKTKKVSVKQKPKNVLEHQHTRRKWARLHVIS